MTDLSAALTDPLNPETDEFIANPYPALHELRQRSPIWWSEKSRRWLVTGFPQAQQILRDRRFLKGMHVWRHLENTNQIPPELEFFIRARSKWMVHLDPPDHTRMRSVVNKAFAPSMVSSLSARAESVLDTLWHKFNEVRLAEVMSDLAGPFVMKLLCEMLGVPLADQDNFSLWSRTVARQINTGKDLQTEHPHVLLFRNYLSEFVTQCRNSAKPGVISMLSEQIEGGDNLTFDDVLDNCNLLIAAGYETTVNAIGNSVLTLQQNPEQLALLIADPQLMRSSIDEILRYESPVQTLIEIAADDMQIEDARMKQGQNVVIILGACNRDPVQFAEPDRFNIMRQQGKSLSFGEGIHHCLGSALAELMIGTFLRKAITVAPEMKILQKNIQFRRPFGLRGPHAIHVRW